MCLPHEGILQQCTSSGFPPRPHMSSTFSGSLSATLVPRCGRHSETYIHGGPCRPSMPRGMLTSTSRTQHMLLLASGVLFLPLLCTHREDEYMPAPGDLHEDLNNSTTQRTAWAAGGLIPLFQPLSPSGRDNASSSLEERTSSK